MNRLGVDDMKLRTLAFPLSVLMTWSVVENLRAIDVPFSARHTVASAFGRFHAVHTADVDGDGDQDILGATTEGDAIIWWKNIAGDGSQWSEHVVNDSFWVAVSVHGADLDGDGDADILGAAYIDSDITWWENSAGDGTVWIEHILNGDFEGAISVRAADLDGDGDLDVVGAAQDADTIAWWENLNGNGSAWMEHTVDGNILTARSVHTADVDGDGDLDIVGAAHDANQVAWWENMDGDGDAWAKHVVNSSFEVAVFAYPADVDGDGDMDIVGAAERDDEVAWFENTSGDDTAWTKHVVDELFDQANSVYAADVDVDGDVDILGTALSENHISWFENLVGDGSAWTEHVVDGNFDGISVHVADMDGDNDLDIVGAAFEPGVIAWWANESVHYQINPGLNGNWWNGPARDGEGAQVEVADGGDGGLVLVATIYSYDAIGNQIFLIAVGPVLGGSAEVDVFITDGGTWGEDFDPEQVNESQWGTGTFTSQDCDSIHMALVPNNDSQAIGYTDLEYDLVRLTTPLIGCPLE